MTFENRNQSIINSTARWGRLSVGLIAIGIAATLFKVAWLKVDPPVQLGDRSGAEQRVNYEPRFRGEITDRNGRTLAIDSPCWRLALDPSYFCSHGYRKMVGEEAGEIGARPDLDLVIDQKLTLLAGPLGLAQEQLRVHKLRTITAKLDDLIGIPKRELTRRLIDAPATKQYVVLEKLLKEWQVDAIRSWLDGRNIGLLLEKRTERRYYGPESLQMIVGKCRDNGVGGSGIEQRREENLQSVRGELKTRRTSRGTVISIPMGSYERGRHGTDFTLTIDAQIQLMAEEALRAQIEVQNAGGGRCVVIDPSNGDILAMVDILNRRPDVEEVILDDPMRRVEPKLGRDRNMIDAFEPGSTFKPFIWSGALEAGVGTRHSVDLKRINVEAVRIKGRRTTVKDAGINAYRGPIKKIDTILIKSLNTGMAEMVRKLSNQEMRSIVKRFGFGSRTNCGLAGAAEHPGQITSLENWSFANTTISVSFGHEVAVTTLQMVRAFSAFCCEGMMPQLRISGHSDVANKGGIDLGPHLLKTRALNPEIARRTKNALRQVVLRGTLKNYGRSDRYSMFGKSGTADLPNPKGGYFKDRYTSNVIAGAPFQDPRIVVYCVIDDPKKNHYGGQVAGPVVKQVVDAALMHLGVKPDLVVEGAEHRASLGTLPLHPGGE
ncbi:MAG: penicillin-binding protein 2 [Phycisphaerales bacterium]|nr:penicillin-binding protein 2 [Phycisphaerales bacterium]